MEPQRVPIARSRKEAIMANTKGREQNSAQPLGERQGTTSKAGTKRTGRRETKAAGPDGPDAKPVGDTFKR
jgi:hypothetical protein